MARLALNAGQETSDNKGEWSTDKRMPAAAIRCCLP